MIEQLKAALVSEVGKIVASQDVVVEITEFKQKIEKAVNDALVKTDIDEKLFAAQDKLEAKVAADPDKYTWFLVASAVANVAMLATLMFKNFA